MILRHIIKTGDTGLLCYELKEVCIVLQAPAALKPKYAKAILRQIYIIDTKAADHILQEAYLVNIFVNPRGIP